MENKEKDKKEFLGYKKSNTRISMMGAKEYVELLDAEDKTFPIPHTVIKNPDGGTTTIVHFPEFCD